MTRTRTLVTGGAGFIGTNMVDRLARSGAPVRVLDDLSRPGTRTNLAWLCERHGAMIEFVHGDVREPSAVRRALSGANRVFHFAAQVAVTSSVTDPLHDFSVNLAGTLNVLEELRRLREPPTLLFTSTNKVYGALEDLLLEPLDQRYRPEAGRWAAGVDEERPLDFCSPYGCSKGAADQYVLDYAKSYGLTTVVFRMSCIYGPHQHGNEDQGWVAHFMKAAMAEEPITIFGDGRQVRDLLYVDDLIEAMLAATDRAQRLAGCAFNIGGGPANSISLLELLSRLPALCGRFPDVVTGGWRVGDQRWYVSDVSRFTAASGWIPRTAVDRGLERLYRWLAARPADAVLEAS